MNAASRELTDGTSEWLSDHFASETGGIDGRLGEPSLPTIGKGTSPRCPTFYTCPVVGLVSDWNSAKFSESGAGVPPAFLGKKNSRDGRPRSENIPNRAAFSLLELLVVIAIIAITATLAITSISGIQRGTAMTTSASQLIDYLNTGRQIAMTINQPVEMWFSQGATNDSLLLYRTDSTNAVEREIKLNERVALSTNAAWSSVLTDVIAGAKSADPKRGVPSYSFRFMPDGSTDLADGASPTLTLLLRTDAGASSLPANFFTLQIDQQTGSVRTFRPQ